MSRATLSRAAAVALLMRWLGGGGQDTALTQPAIVDGPLSQANWTVIVQEAVRHGVHLLLAERWQTTTAAPDYVMRWLAAETAANARRNERLHAELSAILHGAAAQGIELIPFKGAHLLLDRHGYPRPEVRPLADLDLLAQSAQIPALRLLMLRLGYIEEARVTWKHLNFIKPDNTRLSSFSAGDPDNPRRVEVHTALAEDFLGLRLELTSAAWQHSQTPTPVRLLPPWLFFLHLAAHASQDVWERKARLLQLVDLQRVWQPLTRQDIACIGVACGAAAAWFDAQGLQGERPRAVASLAGVRLEPRLLLPALTLLQSVFPGVPPPGLTSALNETLQPGLRAWLQQISLAEVSLSNPAPRRLADNLRWTQRSGERLNVLRHLLLPDRYGLLGNRFPRLVSSPLFPLAYPLHLVFLGGWVQRRLRQRGQRAGISFHQRMLDATAASLAAAAQSASAGSAAAGAQAQAMGESA